MPEISTQHVTTHTVTLTGLELESLREAARIALDHEPHTIHRTAWTALSKLGAPATRSRPGLTDTYANPTLAGRT